MSQSNNQYYKLASIVDNFMIERDLPNGWFNKCLVWAIRGLREIRLDTWNDVTTVVLPVSDRNTVTLPNDFVDWVIVSAYSNGRVETLGVNSDIDLLPRAKGPTASPEYAEVGYYLANFSNGAIFSYGVAMSTKGRFRVSDNGNCKTLVMDVDRRFQEVYIEYITDGFNPNGETVVHPYLYDYMVKYIDLKYEENNNPKATEASIFRKSQDLYFAEKRIRARTNNLDPQTLINLARQHTTLALKI